MNPSVKVAQPGWSADTAPDWALVFNSAWPSLQIAYETTISSNAIDTPIKHGLGYYPLTMAWITYNGLNYGRLQSTTADTQYIYLFEGGASVISNATITVRCYNVDVSKEATYTLPTGAGAKTQPDLTTFIKIAKTNRTITSPNMNDFILNSIAQSPAVLDVATQTGQYYNSGTNTITYPLTTAYIPWVVGALYVSNPAYIYYTVSSLTYNQTANSISLALGTTNKGSLIVLRDPLFYPNTVRVVY